MADVKIIVMNIRALKDLSEPFMSEQPLMSKAYEGTTVAGSVTVSLGPVSVVLPVMVTETSAVAP